MRSRDTSFVRVGDILAGRYRVTQILGTGGMGVVVAVHHIDRQEVRAIKLMKPQACPRPEAAERFLRKAQAAVMLDSKYVPEVYGMGRQDSGMPYVVMERLRGYDLSTIVANLRRLPVSHAVGFMLQVCDALASAHAIGIVHGELKPANLFVAVRPDGLLRIKVLNFGIAAQSARPGSTDVAATRRIVDTLRALPYVSPEQMQPAHPVDARTDIFALGAILYWLLTGRAPFQAPTMLEMIIRLFDDKPALPPSTWRPDVPEELDALILRCLEKDVAARVATVDELRAMLVPFGPGAPPALSAARRRQGDEPAAALGKASVASGEAARTNPNLTEGKGLVSRSETIAGLAAAAIVLTGAAGQFVSVPSPRMNNVAPAAVATGSRPVVAEPDSGPVTFMTASRPIPQAGPLHKKAPVMAGPKSKSNAYFLLDSKDPFAVNR